MRENRKLNIQKNILFSLVSQITGIVCGLIVPGLLLRAYGSETYGAITSITQFLSYIALFEGGIRGVARAVLYKPLAEQDNEKISAIMSEIQRFFHIIAGFFVVYAFILALGYKLLSGLESLDWISSVALVLSISFAVFGEYFVGFSSEILLQASQKSYIKHFFTVFIIVLNTIIIVALIYAGCGVVIVKFVSSCVFLLRPMLYWLYIKRHYNLLPTKKTKTKYLEQKWSGLGQHIAHFFHSNADIVILTLLSSIQSVAVYSIYNMVVSHMQQLTISFTSGMEALFGDMIARDENDELNKTFGQYETLISLITMTLFSITAVLLVPFVQLYTAQINDANYFEPVFAILLTMAAMLYCLRLPYYAVVIAAGHFRQTNKVAYLEAILNISISVLLVRKMGLSGVVIGTVVATAARLIYYVIYLSKNILFRKVSFFFKRFIVNTVIFVVIQLLGRLILDCYMIKNYMQWLLAAIMIGTATLMIILGINLVFYYKEFWMIAKKMLKKS